MNQSLKDKIGFLLASIFALGFGYFSPSFAQTQIYRSTQYGKTSALKVGTGINLTISGTTATFASAMPDTVGVGDAIQYDATGLGAVTNICFISARTSSTVYTVQNATGGTPTACTNDQDWSIFRAYTSWANVESGTENTGISVTVRAFDAGNENLSSANENWNVACYRGFDTDNVDFSGWTFNTNNRLTFYSPTSTAEVGLTQRHAGLYPGTTLTAVNKSGAITFGVSSINQQISFRGIIFHMSAVECSILNFQNANSSSVFEVTESVFVGRNGSGCSGTAAGVAYASAVNGRLNVRNCIFYNFDGSGSNSGAGRHVAIIYTNDGSSTGTIYVYNVTDYNSNYTIDFEEPQGNVVVKNVISQASDTFGFFTAGGASFDAASDYNLSDRAADAPGANSKNSTSVSFVATGSNNFHLNSGDTGAGNSGVDLSADANLVVTTDIDGATRPTGTNTVDMGADEGVVTAAEIDVKGNNVSIADGDATPSASDSTDFGSVVTVGSTRSVTYTISNTGETSLTLSGTPKVAVSGTHAADFTVTTQPTSPVTGGGSTTFVVRFDPSGLGARSAELSITNDDANENPYNFSIQGVGGADVESGSANYTRFDTLSVTLVGAGAKDTLWVTPSESGRMTLSTSSPAKVPGRTVSFPKKLTIWTDRLSGSGNSYKGIIYPINPLVGTLSKNDSTFFIGSSGSAASAASGSNYTITTSNARGYGIVLIQTSSGTNTFRFAIQSSH